MAAGACDIFFGWVHHASASRLCLALLDLQDRKEVRRLYGFNTIWSHEPDDENLNDLKRCVLVSSSGKGRPGYINHCGHAARRRIVLFAIDGAGGGLGVTVVKRDEAL